MQSENGVISGKEPNIDHLDGVGYLMGYPLAHSMSPLLHQTIFKHLGLNWDYFMLQSTDIKQFLSLVRSQKCYGQLVTFQPSSHHQYANTCLGSGVTMPNKVAIMPWLDDITEEAMSVGACNTVFKRCSQLVGSNTDVTGVSESFYQNVSSDVFEGRPGLVIGGGGAARSAVFALVKKMGCKTVYLVNRDPGEVQAVIKWCTDHGYGDGLVHVSTVAQAESLEGAGAIVACVPNYPPATDPEWEARRITECFLNKPHKGGILEMCYHPTPWTEIGALAEKAKWQVILGTEAMIYQGFEQSRLWTGKELSDLPVDEVKKAIASELSKARL